MKWQSNLCHSFQKSVIPPPFWGTQLTTCDHIHFQGDSVVPDSDDDDCSYPTDHFEDDTQDKVS